MAYVKRQRRKIKWKIAIPFFLLIFLLLYLVVNLMFMGNEKNEPERFTICDYSSSKTINELSKQFENSYMISDYFFYGENLNLLKETYDPQDPDEMIGKTLKLVNLCTNEELLFQIEDTVDHQLALGELDNGFYEVYLVYNLQDQRIAASDVIRDEFHTITRNNVTKKVEIIADKNILGKDSPLDQHYLNLIVSPDIKQHDAYDIMIDPAGGNDDYGVGVDWGYEANGLLENDEMYTAALALKEKLEAYGLSVGITKNSMKEEINTYGLNGRLHKAYEKKAKLYINLQFNWSPYDNVSGIEAYHSVYASQTLPNQLLYDLKKNVNLSGSSLYGSSGSVDGVILPMYIEGDDGRKVYDSIYQIREAGGMATQAALATENSRNLNSSFAQNNRCGMQAIVVKFVYISNQEQADFWRNNFDAIMSQMADSIATYLKANIE